MHYVIGDIHGCYNRFMELLNKLYLKEDDIVILIGDIIDRGKQSPQMLKWAMENITADGRFQMVLGNHEKAVVEDYDMTVKNYKNGETLDAAGFSVPLEESGMDIFDMKLLKHESMYGFSRYMEEAGYKTLRDLKPFVDFFNSLPYYKQVSVTDENGKQKHFIVVHAWARLDEDGNIKGSDNTFLWERDIAVGGSYRWTPFHKKFLEDFDPDGYGKLKETLIHGHTPVCLENGYPIDFLIHKRERSINIDTGACFEGGRLAAYCLETDEVIYAEESEEEKRAIEERKEKERIEREKSRKEFEKKYLEFAKRMDHKQPSGT